MNAKAGRPMDRTPNKVFMNLAKTVFRLDSNSKIFIRQTPYNDSNGNRKINSVLMSDKRGRKIDSTPNREFHSLAKKISTNDDGSTVWHIPVNDSKGKRTFRKETRPALRRGRPLDSTPFKVFVKK